MTILTSAAVLALAANCQHVVAPAVIAGIAMHESGGDTAAVHLNVDGSLDRGLMQINTANDAWLGLINPFDPCQSIAAAARLLASYSRYNTGSPTVGAGYAQAITASVRAINSNPSLKEDSAKSAPDPPVYTRHAHSGRELVYSTH